MKIKKGRLREIINEELERFVSKLNQQVLTEAKNTPDRIMAILRELDNKGDV
tara:strand:+ start:529 stop:684 length:156 start_codon:yes stop_codon:yes gene_type:complete